MNNKTLLYILWIVTFIFILVTVGAYILQFNENKISNNPEVWGQFGDYFGGVLNPLLSILNLIILTYLSIRLVKNEDERNKYTLQELARPYGELTFDDDIHEFKISIHNYGLGPMIVNSILLKKENHKTYTNFLDFLNESGIKSDFVYCRTFRISKNHSAIGKDDNITLIFIKPLKESNTMEYERFLKAFKKQINGYEIFIDYCDMYKRKMDTLSDTLDFD
ncbi:hypothetical protein GWA97_07335 [Flavobacterium sp. LaA7.5]|nr:hypothetical protein [Flavobacterium salilacus subsp. altitudinum]